MLSGSCTQTVRRFFLSSFFLLRGGEEEVTVRNAHTAGAAYVFVFGVNKLTSWDAWRVYRLMTVKGGG